MNKLSMASTIRTSCAEMLARKRSIKRMQNSLIELFVDWNMKENQRNLFKSTDGIRKVMKYNKCASLNDKRTVDFHQRFKQESDVFDESRQIWIDKYTDPINDDMFIPRDDAQ